MPWFKKKPNPLDRRLEHLNQQIAELEAQIRQQRRAPPPPAPEQDNGGSVTHPEQKPPAPAANARPRFRTTVNPKNAAPLHGIEPHEVDFFARKDRPVDFSLDEKPASSNPSQADAKPSVPDSATPSLIEALTRLFHKPKSTQNQERLANFLTTGSFQRIKPLRYERRAARNRLILVLLILAVVAILIFKFVF